MRHRYAILFLVIIPSLLWAQPRKKPVQITGMVITNDMEPQFIPYANIAVKKRGIGTMSSSDGFFSFAVIPGDSVLFSCIGFKREYLVVPDTLKENEYLARVILKRDTTMLQEVTLYPWPTPDRLNQALLEARVPTTDNDIAMKNLAIQELKARASEMGYSPEEIQDFVIAANNASIYDYGRYQGMTSGGAIIGALSDPFAWMQFFEALKRGDFKSK